MAVRSEPVSPWKVFDFMRTKHFDEFFSNLKHGHFDAASRILAENPESFDPETEVLQSLVELYRGAYRPTPRTRWWESALTFGIRQYIIMLLLIEFGARLYSKVLKLFGKPASHTYVKYHRLLMPGVVHYRYTNFIKGILQSTFLKGLADEAGDRQWSNYIVGFRGHCLCIFGRFDAGLKALAESTKFSKALIVSDKSQVRQIMFTNLGLEIRTASAFHNGYAGLMDQAEACYQSVFDELKTEPSFYIEALAHSMRTATSLEMLNRQWLREDVEALRRLFSDEKSQWWSLRAASYSALIEANDGNFDHAYRLLQTCEHYYKVTDNRFELMRYHFVRALIELELGSAQNACLHARKSREFVQYIPGAQFHLSEAIIHEVEVTARALLLQVSSTVSAQELKLLKARVLKAVSRIKGCKTLELKAQVISSLLDHLSGQHLTSEGVSSDFRNRCLQRSRRMLAVVNSFDSSGFGKTSQFRPESISNELRDTSVIKKIAELAREKLSQEKISNILVLLFAAESVKPAGIVDLTMENTIQLTELDAKTLTIFFRVESNRALSFIAFSPNFQLGFDTYLQTYLDLLAAFVRQLHGANAEKRAQELQSKIEVYGKVAHDIRSPLSALNMISQLTPELEDAKKDLLNAAIKRINEIANDLMSEREDLQRKTETEKSFPRIFLPYLIESITNEKRVEYHGKAKINVVITDHLKSQAFIECHPQRLKRVLSNIINNAVESGSETIEIQICKSSRTSHELEISVDDNGCGMPQDFIDQIGKRRLSLGKEMGSGFGLYSAYQWLSEWNALLNISSTVGSGTSVKIFFPLAEPAAWYTPTNFFRSKTNLVLIDDDRHQKTGWERFVGHHENSVSLRYYASPEALPISICHDEREFFLVDYDLKQDITGLQFIILNNLQNRSVLVTDNYDDPNVIGLCERHNVRLFPKPSASAAFAQI